MEMNENLETAYNFFKRSYRYDIPNKLSILIKLYEDLIDECKEGYSFTIYELDDELSLRDFIEDFLRFLEKKNDALYNNLQASMTFLDSKLKNLFTTKYLRPITGDESRWWHRGILKYSGQDYAKNVKSEYRLEVKVIDV